MNRTGHALSGVAAGVWSLPVAPVDGVAGSVAWVAACAGFALAPDLDHPGSTAARMWGPVTRLTARAVGAVVGHRGATHQVAAVGVVGAVVWLATSGRVAPAAAWLAAHLGIADPANVGAAAGHAALLAVGAVTVGLALAALRVPALPNFGLSWLTAALAARLDVPLVWLPWAAALGVAAHLAGDAITKRGLPGPAGRRVGLRVIRTGGPAETLICCGLALAIAAYPFRGYIAAFIEGVNA